jgi:hypothetical protein
MITIVFIKVLLMIAKTGSSKAFDDYMRYHWVLLLASAAVCASAATGPAGFASSCGAPALHSPVIATPPS